MQRFYLGSDPVDLDAPGVAGMAEKGTFAGWRERECQMSNVKLTDLELRALHSRVYGECNDSIWYAIRRNYLLAESLAWLEKEAEKIDAKEKGSK